MGGELQSTTSTMTKKKKKKGRPSLLDLQKRSLKQQQNQHQQFQQLQQQQQQQQQQQNPSFNSSNPNRRSTRQNPNFVYDHDGEEDDEDGDGGDDDDDERRQKKHRLLHGLNNSDNYQRRPVSNSGFNGSDALNRRGIIDGRTGSDKTEQKVSKATDTLLGILVYLDILGILDIKVFEFIIKLCGFFCFFMWTGLLPVESGPTTPLPDKKLLVFVLDRLQKFVSFLVAALIFYLYYYVKVFLQLGFICLFIICRKDTYGVFSDPVDPEELPDYHDIIAHPMDFATVRSKLDGGAYANLEDFEEDVLLICSNAMQYNSSDTVYFRQARSIQELAKKDFENLRQDSDDDSEPQPQQKVARRGRPPKNLKKFLDTSPSDRIASEFASDAILANGADNGCWSSGHNLRKGPMTSYKFRPAEVLTKASHGSHAGDSHTYGVYEWESEFPASVVKAVMKYGKKHFPVDEHKRDTYMDSLASDHEPSVFKTFEGELKQLTVVGLNTEHGYARSLARFAADLGPDVWQIASRKIQSVLPNGVKFGPGWVGENRDIEQQQYLYGEKQKSSNNYISGNQSSRLMSPTTPGSNSVLGNRYSSQVMEDTETIREVNSQSESTFLNNSLGEIKPAPAFQTPSRPVIQTDTNGFTGSDGFGFNWQPHMGMVRLDTPLGKSSFDSSSTPSQMHGMVPVSNNHGISSMPANDYNPNVAKLAGSSSRLQFGMVPGSGFGSCTTMGPKHQGNSSWQGFSAFHKQDFQPFASPDLNARFLAPGSPISTMQIGSTQQPDLALQL
ncbi:hypothetical protein Dsin_003888 [Dipteronia sinensis]|uniref:Bromo domain-containing protein n=1 Tax=Dipteronia sinensis TaxID=43782 RepID=A0AAE0B8X3_9ROSI|nr:hypothetical protein Dsin_003888 [Dipteronia sinensis]